MLTLTQELFGATDPDLQRGTGTPEEMGAVIMEFFSYFAELTQQRMAEPTDDLASLIANGEIRGEPMPALEKLGYYIIIATAGHDTTSASMSEGMAQLAKHPDQLELLRSDPSLIPNAVEEMIRLASPVRHFMRTATADTEIAGQPIETGRLADVALHGGEPRPEALRRTRSSSTSPGRTPTSRSPSGSASTSASAPNWPVRSCARCSRTSSRASPAPSWPAAKRPAKRSSSAATSPCHSATPSRNPSAGSTSRNCWRTLRLTRHSAPISGILWKVSSFCQGRGLGGRWRLRASIATHRPPHVPHGRAGAGHVRADARCGDRGGIAERPHRTHCRVRHHGPDALHGAGRRQPGRHRPSVRGGVLRIAHDELDDHQQRHSPR